MENQHFSSKRFTLLTKHFFRRQNRGFVKVNNLTEEHSMSLAGLIFALFMLISQWFMSHSGYRRKMAVLNVLRLFLFSFFLRCHSSENQTNTPDITGNSLRLKIEEVRFNQLRFI